MGAMAKKSNRHNDLRQYLTVNCKLSCILLFRNLGGSIRPYGL